MPTSAYRIKSLLGRFLKQYAKPYTWSYIGGLFFLLATTALTVAIPHFVELAVDALEPPSEGFQPDVSRAIFFAWAIIISGFAVMVVRTLSRVLFFNPGRAIEYHLKSDLFRHLTALPRKYYDRMSPGELVSRGTNDAQAVRGFVGFGTLQVFNVAFTLLFSLGKMFAMDWGLSLWMILPLSIAALVLFWAIRRMFHITKVTQQELANLSARVLETYGGAGLLQVMNAEEVAQDRFEERNKALLSINEEMAFVIAWLLPIVRVVGNACLVLLLFIGGQKVIHGVMTTGELAAFAVLIRIVTAGLNSMGWLLNSLQRGWISLGRVYEVLDVPLPKPTRGEAGLEGLEGLEEAAVVVKDLSFAYDSGSEGKQVLEGLSFELERGQTLGIFGPTGAGKSTLLDVLTRVQEPGAGQVFFEGKDVLSYDLASFRERLAYVPQEPWLFSQSLRENIALADKPEERDDERVEKAVASARLSQDMAHLPHGLETRVGERGVMLSGGQRQRAALARAFYRPFELLVLDDVLSAVDHATEKDLIESIYKTIEERGKAVSTIIVSHRVSALQHAEQIIVLDEGKMIAKGTHQELVEEKGSLYRRAWRLQNAEGGKKRKDLADSPQSMAGEA